MLHIKIVVERHPDTFVAYPLGLKNAVAVGQGDTYQEAIEDARGAILALVEEFGPDIFDTDTPLLNASIEDVEVSLA